jgi:hypothetical protein
MDVDAVSTEEDADTGVVVITTCFFVVGLFTHNDANATVGEVPVHSVVNTPNDSYKFAGFEVVFSSQHPTSMLAI